MDLISLLFSFEGRINRAKNWLAALVYLVAGMTSSHDIALAVAGVLGAPIRQRTAMLFPILFYAIAYPLYAVGIWTLAATTIKRLRDRNKSGWWFVPFMALPILLPEPETGSATRAWRFPWTCRFRSQHLGLCRAVLPEGDARTQPVRARSAAAAVRACRRSRTGLAYACEFLAAVLAHRRARMLCGRMTDALSIARDLVRCPSVTPADAGALGVLENILKAAGFRSTASPSANPAPPISTTSMPASATPRRTSPSPVTPTWCRRATRAPGAMARSPAR